MSTKKLREVEAKALDQDAAKIKVMKDNHAAGRHQNPLSKCEDCRAMPDYHERRAAAFAVPEHATPANPTGVSPKRGPGAIRVLGPLPEPVPTIVKPRRSKKAPVPPVVEQPAEPEWPLPRARRLPGSKVIEVFDEAGSTTLLELRDGMKAFTRPTTREAWLIAAIDDFRPIFEGFDAKLPEVRVSIGWPAGRSAKGVSNAIGQCWAPAAVEDGIAAIFISPELKAPVDILATLIHELVHAAGNFHHRVKFAKLAANLGLKGPWTATTATPELAEELTKLAEKLGPFPHGKIRKGSLSGEGPARPPKQGTRMLLAQCVDCGCKVRMTQKWIDEAGLPTCGCGGMMEQSQ